jgi:hypothetical protein
LPNSSERPNKTGNLSLSKGVRALLGGRVGIARATLEAFRRGRAAVSSRRERAMLADLALQPARLRQEFQVLSSSDLLKHFCGRERPSFSSGFETAKSTANRQRELFPDETEQLVATAEKITNEHRWPLLGFGEKEFGAHLNWHRDPISGRIWPLDYHADITLWHNDGSDIRVLWELNRLGHLITLGRAAAVTNREEFNEEILIQLESWREQNPVGLGANWSCAMEVALRALNLLAVFSLLQGSPHFNKERLQMFLTTFDQHGAHIRRNLEFSYLATSNHYLSDVVGLLWLGIMLPELALAEEWRAWALQEMLHELDKQILPDGADYEGSTGYHSFVLQLFLYSFLLCRINQIEIPDRYWRQLESMLIYLRAILRPDGLAPLIGDTDGGQVLPIVSRNANDHAYLLALGATVFKDAQLKPAKLPGPPDLLWLLGEDGLRNYEELGSSSAEVSSQAFVDAGTYVLRHDDFFLLFNASGSQKGRPVSHHHNDVLSIEVSACGRAFIVDPGSYVYTADLHERHLFRSTAYHSTVEIDDAEQQTICEEVPFAIGGEARSRVLVWETTPERDRVVAEHYGYERLADPVTHRRAITFDKANSWWLIEDEFFGNGEHQVATRFHFDAGLEITLTDQNSVLACDAGSRAGLLVRSLDLEHTAELESQFTSGHYGAKSKSLSACWATKMNMPGKLRWAIIPVRASEDQTKRLRILSDL